MQDEGKVTPRTGDRATGEARTLPRFEDATVVLRPSELRYNPHNDVIFPSVVRMADHLPAPIDAFYMYYAPHDPPGGICLATAPAPMGPWTECPGNPIINRSWPPHHQVAHVSSPHVLWIEEEQRFFCFYHGDNDVTRYASSADGIVFSYEGEALSCADLPPSESISYNRVYRHELALACRYVMLVVQYHPTRQGIYVARSSDARRWQVDAEPLLRAPVVPDSRYAWSPCLVCWKGQWSLVYHVDYFTDDNLGEEGLVTNLWASTVDRELTRTGPPFLLVEHETFNGPGAGRVADPCLFEDSGTLYLFASVGRAHNQYIVCAKGVER